MRLTALLFNFLYLKGNYNHHLVLVDSFQKLLKIFLNMRTATIHVLLEDTPHSRTFLNEQI